MSVHIIDTVYDGKPIRIKMGWDRRLQRCYLSYERLDDVTETDKEGDVPWMFTMFTTVVSFKEKLDRLGFKIPEGMYKEVFADQRRNVGNRIVAHTVVDGKHKKEVIYKG